MLGQAAAISAVAQSAQTQFEAESDGRRRYSNPLRTKEPDDVRHETGCRIRSTDGIKHYPLTPFPYTWIHLRIWNISPLWMDPTSSRPP
jgi:hypothetical protein